MVDIDMMRSPVASKPRSLKKSFKWLLVLVIAVFFVVSATSWFVWGKNYWLNLGIGKGYQAVFLTNGQVYFGKLQINSGWAILKDIYYLQVTQDLQPASNGSTTPVSSAGGQSQSASTPSAPVTTSTNQTNNRLQLVKLGSELHGPEDIMYIVKDKVLFWENMKDDSQVMQAIKQAQAAKK